MANPALSTPHHAALLRQNSSRIGDRRGAFLKNESLLSNQDLVTLQSAARQSTLAGWVPVIVQESGLERKTTLDEAANRPDFSPPRRSVSPGRSKSPDRSAPAPPHGPPPAGCRSPIRRRLASKVQLEELVSNRPPLENRNECHLQAHAKGGGPKNVGALFEVPLDFLSARVEKVNASSEKSSSTKADNVIERSGSFWCSEALRPLVKGPVASTPSETPSSHRASLKGMVTKNLASSLGVPGALSNVASAVMSKQKMSDMFRRRTTQQFAEEEEEKQSDDPFESEPEWMDITFPEGVLLSSLSIRWARHYAAHYYVLAQSSSTSSSATLPFWMPAVAPPLFTLEDTVAAPQWRVVHVERDGQGGLEVINFPTPVCTRALRLYMTRPGNTAGVSLSECFYAVCGINAEPLQLPTGSGLRAEYFSKPPPPHLGLFARPHFSRLEPLTRAVSVASIDRKVDDQDLESGVGILGLPQGDGVLGENKHVYFTPGFASFTGFLRIEKGGMYTLELRPEAENGTFAGVKFRMWVDEDFLHQQGAKKNDKLTLDFLPEEEEQNKSQYETQADESGVILFERFMHLGCHALFLEVEAPSAVPMMTFSYCGPDTFGKMQKVRASNLTSPILSDASLSSLAAKPGGLPNFAPHIRSHKVPLLPYNISTSSIVAMPTQPKAKMYVALTLAELEKPGTEIEPGIPSRPFPLAVGSTSLLVRVVAEDLKTRSTYRLELVRDTVNDCHIMELEVTTPSCVGTWYRTFEIPRAGNQDVITVPQLPYFALTAVVTAKTRNNACKIYIAKGPSKHRLQDEENHYPSGEPSQPVSLHVGFNVIYVRVLSADRRLSKNWTLSIERLASSDATLKIVSVSPGDFRQFLPSKDEYAIDAPFSSDIRSCRVHAEANHADAKIYIAAADPRRNSIKRGENRIDRSFRIETLDLSLRVGSNTLYIRVVAQDNTTSKTYTVHCTCLAPPLLNLLPALAVPVTFAASSGHVPDFDDGCLTVGESTWYSGGSLWRSEKSEDGTPEWVEIQLGAPLLVASVKVHWAGNIDPAYTVFIRGQSLRELGVSTGPVPLCVPLAQMGGEGTKERKRTTRTGWQVEHFAELETTGNTTEIIDLESMEDDTDALPKNLVDNLGRGWRLVARGQGDSETLLAPPLVIRSLRIAVLRPKVGEALAIDKVELLPPTAQAVGSGLVTELFLGDTQRLAGGCPDIVALEPSLDMMNDSALSMQVPSIYTTSTWAARYHGLLDILEGGNYTFWVETDRQREDQNVLWRFSVDSQILELEEPQAEPEHKRRTSASGRKSRKGARPGSASKARSGQFESNQGDGSSDTGTCSDTGMSALEDGESSSGGPADSDTSDTGSASSQSGSLSRTSSKGSLTPQRTGTFTPQKTENQTPTNAGKEKKKSKRESKKKKKLTAVMAGRLGGKGLPQGMNLPLLPGAHHINLEVLVLHEKPLEKKIHKVEEEMMMRTGSRRPSKDASANNEEEGPPIRTNDPNSPRSPGLVAAPNEAPLSPASYLRMKEEEMELQAKSGVKLNLAYRGPDTKGTVIVVPPVALAPPWASLRHEVLKPTATLQVRAAVGSSWHAASVMMMEWMEDEIFVEQLHSVSAHSLDQEGHYLGACQLIAVYDESQHCGTRLKGLRSREWEYRGDSVPEEILDSVTELVASKRFVAFASSSDLQYDEAVMRSVIPNVLMVWYVDETPEPEDCVPVQYERGCAASAQEAGDDIAAWMQRSGLRRGDLLSMTVHPKRKAGARLRTLGTASEDTSSESVEWIALYRARGPRRRRAERADHVKCKVWSMQKPWHACFAELTHSNVSSQTLVGYASSCLLTNGSIRNVQVALWQSSMRPDAEPLSDDDEGAPLSPISADKGQLEDRQDTPSQGDGRNTALGQQSTACPSVASRPMSRIQGRSSATPLGMRGSTPSPGPNEQSDRERLQSLLPFNAEVDCDVTLEDLLPERPEDIQVEPVCVEDEEGEKLEGAPLDSDPPLCESSGPLILEDDSFESQAVCILENVYRACVHVEEKSAVARYVSRIEYDLLLRIERPELCYVQRLVNEQYRAVCVAYARQYIRRLSGGHVN